MWTSGGRRYEHATTLPQVSSALTVAIENRQFDKFGRIVIVGPE